MFGAGVRLANSCSYSMYSCVLYVIFCASRSFVSYLCFIFHKKFCFASAMIKETLLHYMFVHFEGGAMKEGMCLFGLISKINSVEQRWTRILHLYLSLSVVVKSNMAPLDTVPGFWPLDTLIFDITGQTSCGTSKSLIFNHND